ncbi:unnamed protein product [Rhizophagus irregularis]|nr:unnamed protein product [Rhizophagus irregularis]CAB4419757.1 unnamed protein product [Rhizophagus irregularis]
MLTYSSDEPTYYSLSSMLYNEETSSLSASSLIILQDHERITIVGGETYLHKVEDVIVIKLWHWINRKRNINGEPLTPLNLLQILST